MNPLILGFFLFPFIWLLDTLGGLAASGRRLARQVFRRTGLLDPVASIRVAVQGAETPGRARTLYIDTESEHRAQDGKVREVFRREIIRTHDIAGERISTATHEFADQEALAAVDGGPRRRLFGAELLSLGPLGWALRKICALPRLTEKTP